MATAILDESARELAWTVATVYPRLGMSAVPLVITDGTILHGTYLTKAFNHDCETQGLIFTSVHYVAEPAEGALKLA